MGNVDSRSQFFGGYMMLATQQPFYSPGQQISGQIYVRNQKALNAKMIEIEVVGKEKVKIQSKEAHHTQNDQGRQIVEYKTKKNSSKKNIFHFKAPAFIFPEKIAPGDYAIPFGFMLPKCLPSSFFFQNKQSIQKPSAKIKYVIKATMIDHSGHKITSYKQVLIIRETVPLGQENISSRSELKITTGCCKAQGTAAIDTIFEKNIFNPTEVCKAQVMLDNANCNINMNTVRLSVQQVITIRSDDHTFSDTITLVSSSVPGSAARNPTKEARELMVDLKAINFQIPHEHKKKGAMKKISAEDHFMLSQLQAACHGTYVSNEYFIKVETNFDGCTCCSSTPQARVPITIVPMVNPACFGFQTPQDFQPTYCPDVKVYFSH